MITNNKRTIVIISCSSTKAATKTQAKDLYISPLFKKSLGYAKSLKPDKILILSAKHGMVHLEEEIAPYDETLKNKSSIQKRAWATKVLEQLEAEANVLHDHFVILAGKEYWKYLLPHFKSYDSPLEGMRLGERLKYLASRL